MQAAESAGVAIAVAESCTGGLIAGALTAIAGASQVVHEGVVAYTAAAKTDRLDVSPSLIDEHDIVSEQVAAAMAEGLLAQAVENSKGGKDYLAIATTGYAGPTGGTDRDPVGTVYCRALPWSDANRTHPNRRRTSSHCSSGHRKGPLLLAWQRSQAGS